MSTSQPQESQAPSPKFTLWELVDNFIKSVPPEEFEKLPKDGAAQHDHYIYGTPKKTE